MAADEPPFVTDTLARLYLAQGHYASARAMAKVLPETAAVAGELERVRAGRIGLLRGLLDGLVQGLGRTSGTETTMSFHDTLETLCRSVDGAFAASIMGYDGISVETLEGPAAGDSAVNLSSAMVEYSSIFGQIRQAASQLEAGEASELTIRTERLVAIARAVSPEYFVVVALAPEANAGKARFALRVGAGKIAAEL